MSGPPSRTLRTARPERPARYESARADYVFQLLLVGPPGSGKTSLLRCIQRDGRPEDAGSSPRAISGVDAWPCWWIDRGLRVRLTWFDAPGGERYADQAMGYVRNANAVLLVCHPDQPAANQRLWDRIEELIRGLASPPPLLFSVVRPLNGALLPQRPACEFEADAVSGRGVMSMVDRVVEECLLRVRKKSTPLLVLAGDDPPRRTKDVPPPPHCWCQ